MVPGVLRAYITSSEVLRCFLEGIGGHLDLHSFPTRRSSDLSASATEAPALRARETREQRTNGVAPRSEEHTSELQSQSNLVCRLLLEKKKTIVSLQDIFSAIPQPLIRCLAGLPRTLHLRLLT